ncbi:transporter substrate-binding domain-containing protein [Paenibacillus hamazuiensis]|uniref:transporter substrate-binding domain-containing protein n=1 Tax=Paenibacillus hamazuiensis TaxID=2936508 RepID=UPI00200D9E17|nr:transporter substrate-binding domain-containing protein [Paenibacillus hamazuiensis]
MRKLHIYFLLIASLALVLSLTGCFGSTAAPGNGVENSILAKVVQSKKLKVGVILSYPPFGFKDEKGNPQGYDVDIAKELAKSLNAELEIMDLDSSARIPAIETGKVDAVIGSFSRTYERLQKVNVSAPYSAASEKMLVRKDSTIAKVTDLNDKKVAVVKGSTNQAVTELAPQAQLAYFSNSAECVLAVKNGQADAFVEDESFLAYQAKLYSELKVVGDPLVPTLYQGIAVRKGDQEWLNYLNFFVFQINNQGTNKSIYTKWFGINPPYPLNPQY